MAGNQPRPDDLMVRLARVRDRVAEERQRMEADRWLAEHGSGTYNARTTGRSLVDRRTRPIRVEYFDRIVREGKCLGCGAGLVRVRKPDGGTYHACAEARHACYYIGIDRKAGTGYELIVSAAGAVAV